MNQQLIFNNDFALSDDREAVSCSVLQSGLRIAVMIKMPDGWEPQAWLDQIKEDSFFWEEQIEEAFAEEKLSSDGILYIDGAA
jgi:hypothetical protein